MMTAAGATNKSHLIQQKQMDNNLYLIFIQSLIKVNKYTR